MKTLIRAMGFVIVLLVAIFQFSLLEGSAQVLPPNEGERIAFSSYVGKPGQTEVTVEVGTHITVGAVITSLTGTGQWVVADLTIGDPLGSTAWHYTRTTCNAGGNGLAFWNPAWWFEYQGRMHVNTMVITPSTAIWVECGYVMTEIWSGEMKLIATSDYGTSHQQPTTQRVRINVVAETPPVVTPDFVPVMDVSVNSEGVVQGRGYVYMMMGDQVQTMVTVAGFVYQDGLNHTPGLTSTPAFTLPVYFDRLSGNVAIPLDGWAAPFRICLWLDPQKLTPDANRENNLVCRNFAKVRLDENETSRLVSFFDYAGPQELPVQFDHYYDRQAHWLPISWAPGSCECFVADWGNLAVGQGDWMQFLPDWPLADTTSYLHELSREAQQAGWVHLGYAWRYDGVVAQPAPTITVGLSGLGSQINSAIRYRPLTYTFQASEPVTGWYSITWRGLGTFGNGMLTTIYPDFGSYWLCGGYGWFMKCPFTSVAGGALTTLLRFSLPPTSTFVMTGTWSTTVQVDGQTASGVAVSVTKTYTSNVVYEPAVPGQPPIRVWRPKESEKKDVPLIEYKGK